MPPVPPNQISPFPRARKRRSPPTTAPREDGKREGGDDQQDEDEQQNNDDARHALPASSRRPLATRRHDRDDTSVHQRHGDRASDDDAAPPPLRQWVRFKDLRNAGIVGSWPQLARLISGQNFPVGRYIGPNTRVWEVTEVEAWLESRPIGSRRERRQTTNTEATL